MTSQTGRFLTGEHRQEADGHVLPAELVSRQSVVSTNRNEPNDAALFRPGASIKGPVRTEWPLTCCTRV